MGGKVPSGEVSPEVAELTELEVLARVLDSLTRLLSLDGRSERVRSATGTTVAAIEGIVKTRHQPTMVFQSDTPIV